MGDVVAAFTVAQSPHCLSTWPRHARICTMFLVSFDDNNDNKPSRISGPGTESIIAILTLMSLIDINEPTSGALVLETERFFCFTLSKFEKQKQCLYTVMSPICIYLAIKQTQPQQSTSFSSPVFLDRIRNTNIVARSEEGK